MLGGRQICAEPSADVMSSPSSANSVTMLSRPFVATKVGCGTPSLATVVMLARFGLGGGIATVRLGREGWLLLE